MGSSTNLCKRKLLNKFRENCHITLIRPAHRAAIPTNDESRFQGFKISSATFELTKGMMHSTAITSESGRQELK